jgi:hypothetical protein
MQHIESKDYLRYKARASLRHLVDQFGVGDIRDWLADAAENAAADHASRGEHEPAGDYLHFAVSLRQIAAPAP